MNKTIITAATVLGMAASGMLVQMGSASADSTTCKVPYVWRNARPGDAVCVDAQTRTNVASENANPSVHRQPGGGAYGPDTCAASYVWREAFPGDTICVSTKERDDTAADNAAAASRVAPVACQTWRAPGSVIGLAEDNGVTVDVEVNGQTLGPSSTAFGPHQPSVNGPTTGSINGNQMRVSIRFENGTETDGTLTINPDGTGNGRWSSVGNVSPSGGAMPYPVGSWRALDKFMCER